MLGPMLINIYINDIFFALNEFDIYKFSDDIGPYVCDSNLKLVLEKFKHNSELTVAWFEMNYLKLNTDKYYLLILGNKNEHMWAKLDQNIVWESNGVEILGVKIDSNLRFHKHVSKIYLKANRKLSALTRVAKFVPFKRRRIPFKTFIEPLAWMFHGRKINDKINKLHEKFL